MNRLFLAIPLSTELTTRIRCFASLLNVDDVKVVPEHHLTLKFFGDVVESEIPSLVNKITALRARYSPFSLSLRGVGAFPSTDHINVIWIGVDGPELHALMEEIEQLFPQKEKREVVPHLTIARVKSAKSKVFLQEFLRQHKDDFFGTMDVHDVVLYESILTPEGARHTPLHTFILGKQHL